MNGHATGSCASNLTWLMMRQPALTISEVVR